MLLIILILILILYLRTYNYNYLIDDFVKRDGYLVVVPNYLEHQDKDGNDQSKKPPIEFFAKKRPIIATVINISVFMASCGYIYLLFGWKTALLYAVCPLNVMSVAWITGNYYQTTVMFCLAAEYFMRFS